MSSDPEGLEPPVVDRTVTGSFKRPDRGSGLEVAPGRPDPLGATPEAAGVNFAVVSAHATAVELVVFEPGAEAPLLEHLLEPEQHRTGDVWHAFVAGLGPDVEYGYRARREPNPEPWLHRFDPARLLVDPYARALAGAERWGGVDGGGPEPTARRWRSRVVAVDSARPVPPRPARHPADMIIYELGVRGFTAHPSSGVSAPGTFRGLAEKIPYLVDLGVTAVELMPIAEWDELDHPGRDPATGERLRNLWGYQPLAWFAPKAGLAASGPRGGQLEELRALVSAMHGAGIAVLVDVVFNHTGENGARAPAVSWRGLDNPVYYHVDPGTGAYFDFTGCGNTVNCNHPVVRRLILDCLRYWVSEIGVDGFRFDLASVLARGRDTQPLADPPLLEMIAGDAVLAGSTLIAEAWDAAGLYQVGAFPSWGRWSEWNGRYRDDLRLFFRGDPGTVPALATRIAGSADLYRASGRAPYHSVNFVTSHDGFTLADLVSYERKRNQANGEGNRDGADHEHSFNCGVEGPTDDPEIVARRRRCQRNMLAVLLLSQGVPMLRAGDEFSQSQGGNNNAYCQDNPVGWIDWSLVEREAELVTFVRRLISLRRAHPNLRRRAFFEDDEIGVPGVVWHGPRLGRPDWSAQSRSIALHLPGNGTDDDLYVAINHEADGRTFELPPLVPSLRWHRAVDTARRPGADAADLGAEAPLAGRAYPVGGESVVVLVAKRVG